MHFAEHFDITLTKEDDWFDTIVETDTPLFIDPFLVFKRGDGLFQRAHDRIIRFFQTAFEIGAQTGGDRDGTSYAKLKAMLTFPEVKELCLGHVREGIEGGGTARVFAERMASAVLDAILTGVTQLDHFEEIGLFRKGIGPDRISDATANLLKPELVAYTQAVCSRHSIPVKPFHLRHLGFDYDHLIWDENEVELPVNPLSPSRGIVLVPKQFLRRLPAINAVFFWHYVYDHYDGDYLRQTLNFDIARNLKKDAIIEIAKEHWEWVEEYVTFVETNVNPAPYDLDKDRAGIYGWARPTRMYAEQHPVSLHAKSEAEFVAVIEEILQRFKHYVEETRGYELLWNDDFSPKPEDAAQLVFFGIAREYCRANDIDPTKEANLGRGPVDFKFSSGYANRALIEVKLASNTKFWHGLRKQLPKYLEVEEIRRGYFLVVCHTKQELEEKVAPIQAMVEEVKRATSRNLAAVVVDATQNKPSASKLP